MHAKQPWCYNRPERVDGHWEDTGRRHQGIPYDLPSWIWCWQRNEWIAVPGIPADRPILRWKRVFADVNACHAYDEPIGTMPTAMRSGWNCEGCKWLPEHAEDCTRPFQK